MDRKEYKAPTVRLLGTVADLTGEGNGTGHKFTDD
jgi:hypothetical protein